MSEAELAEFWEAVNRLCINCDWCGNPLWENPDWEPVEEPTLCLDCQTRENREREEEGHVLLQ